MSESIESIEENDPKNLLIEATYINDLDKIENILGENKNFDLTLIVDKKSYTCNKITIINLQLFIKNILKWLIFVLLKTMILFLITMLTM